MIHMSKKWLLACLMVLVMLVLTGAALAEQGEVTASSLYMREKPSSSSKAVRLLQKGTKVEILEKSGSWYLVTYGKYSGYVYDDYIAILDDGVMEKGDKNDDVKKLQERLKELGYFKNTCNGTFANTTVTAVKAFQKQNGLTQDGVVGKDTLKKINSNNAITASGKTYAQVQQEAAKAAETLEKGDKGDEVKKLQERLKELGYFKNTCNGTYANTTVTAVKAFQKKNGLTQDGVVGKATLNKINSNNAITASGRTYAQVQQEAAKAAETLEKGDKGDAVKKLQERLKELGFFKGTCNGTFGNTTVTAVKAFQKKNGLKQDGIVGKATLNEINASSAKNVDGKTLAQVEKEQKENSKTLQKGSRGDDVLKLQRRLKELGYYTSTLSTYYGDNTTAAVKAFQKNNGIKQDGIAGQTTLNKIYADSAKNVNGKTLAQVEKEKEELSKTLKHGDKGNDVLKLQQRLKELGYYNSTLSTYFGTNTLEAVKAFQKRNGLTADGICGTATLRKLNSANAVKNKVEEVKDDGALEKGDQGNEVKKVQERLQELGYYSDICNGNFGTNTFNAVKKFQANNGLTQDGRVTKATLNKLNSANPTTANGTKFVDLKTSQTLKHGDNNLQVKSLQNELKRLGYYTGTLTTNFGNNTKAAVTAFQRANKLTVNGVANPATLRKILSSSAVTKAEADEAAKAPKYKTERLDWFNGGRNKFAGRPVIEIKDVRTGLVFKAKVLYGTNHLDVEPLTKADTATLLKINGGVEFKWNRRPMLVKHNGHVYAASIYSVPHGEQTITNNNFDGQFCLHFYGSKTHGSDEVKQDHQDAIAQAMKATW